MNQRRFEIGDTVYTFLGEMLVHFEVTEYYDDIKIAGKNEDETFCVFEKYCYWSQHEATIAMIGVLFNMIDEKINFKCNHEWRAKIPQIQLASAEIPMMPMEINREVYCHKCGVKKNG